MDSKHSFLVCYDYGTGGVWFLMTACSAADIRKLHPQFVVFEDKPDWMTVEDKAEYIQDITATGFHWDIDDPQQGWLAEVLLPAKNDERM